MASDERTASAVLFVQTLVIHPLVGERLSDQISRE